MAGRTVDTPPRARSLPIVGAVCVVVGSAVASTRLMLAWRSDQRASHVRLDVLGRERNLVTWVLADAERVIEGDGTAVEAISAHLQLLRQSWLVARDGGTELGLDLRPSGRRVVGWPVLGADYRSVEAALFVYAELVEGFVADGHDHRGELPELRTRAANVVAQLNDVTRAASDEALDDKRFIWSVSLLVVAVGSLVGAAVAFVHRGRLRVAVLRAAEAELRGLATVDALTGLPNRRAVVEHLAGALDRQRRSPERLAVLFLDLDGFKAINDSLGHEAGDELLAAAARRIRTVVRPGDLVGRYGGDEFVIIVESLLKDDEVRGLADRLERTLSQPFPLSAGTALIGGSVGIAKLARDATLDTLLAAADAAMYERKRQRRPSGHPADRQPAR